MKHVLTSLVCGLFGATAFAHHGDAGRFEEELTTLSGTVVVLQLVNPHASILMEVHGEDGSTVRWHVEMEGPQRLVRSFGWNRNTLKAGDRITVVGRVLKSGAPHINLTDNARIISDETCREIYRSQDLGEELADTPGCS